MMPAVDLESLGFLPCLVGAWYFAVATHELGHALGGRLAGMRIVACGLGYAKPFVRLKIGRTHYFIGRRNPLAGLALPARSELRHSRGTMLAFIAGGPTANLLEVVATFGLWQAGVQIAFIPMLFYVAFFLFVTNLLPLKVRTNAGATFRSDGMQLFQFWKGTRWQDVRPGEELGTARAIVQLCRDLHSPEGVAQYSALLAINLAGLGDAEGAREALRSSGAASCSVLYAYALAMIATAENPLDAEPVIQQAIEACRDDRVGLAGLELTRLRSALENREATDELAQRALQAARASGYPDIVANAHALSLEIGALAPLVEHAESLLSRKEEIPRPAATLRLLGVAASRLVETGDVERARPLFVRANALLADLAGGITEDVARTRFLTSAARPLRQAVLGQSEGTPLFVAPARPAPSARLALASLTWAVLGLELFVFIIVSAARYGHDLYMRPGLLIFGLWACCLVGILQSLSQLRKPGVRGIAWRGLLLNILVGSTFFVFSWAWWHAVPPTPMQRNALRQLGLDAIAPQNSGDPRDTGP